MAEYTFGIPVSGGTNWLMQNVTRNHVTDDAEARDGDGNVAANKQYNEREEFSATATIPTGTSAPAVGTDFSYDGVVYRLTSVNRTNGNTAYETYAISGKRYITNGIPAQSSTSSN